MHYKIVQTVHMSKVLEAYVETQALAHTRTGSVLHEVRGLKSDQYVSVLSSQLYAILIAFPFAIFQRKVRCILSLAEDVIYRIRTLIRFYCLQH